VVFAQRRKGASKKAAGTDRDMASPLICLVGNDRAPIGHSRILVSINLILNLPKAPPDSYPKAAQIWDAGGRPWLPGGDSDPQGSRAPGPVICPGICRHFWVKSPARGMAAWGVGIGDHRWDVRA
jgi:hypothetical protein